MLHSYNLEETLLVQAAFLSPLLFLCAYSRWHSWWSTVHGRTLATLALAIPVVLLRSVLGYWHIVGTPASGAAASLRELAADARHDPAVAHALNQLMASVQPDLGNWLTIQFLMLIPLAFAVMTWQVVRPHASGHLEAWQDSLSRWLRRVRPAASDQNADPLTRDAERSARTGRHSIR